MKLCMDNLFYRFFVLHLARPKTMTSWTKVLVMKVFLSNFKNIQTKILSLNSNHTTKFSSTKSSSYIMEVFSPNEIWHIEIYNRVIQHRKHMWDLLGCETFQYISSETPKRWTKYWKRRSFIGVFTEVSRISVYLVVKLPQIV